MSFATQRKPSGFLKENNAEVIVEAYGGVYPVHPDADVDHRRCLAAALCKVVELVFKDMPVEEFTESQWHMGYGTASTSYKLELLNIVDALMEEKTGGFQ